MSICFVCQEEIFLKAYQENIDGEDRYVCGKCRDTVCACCGKTKKKDGITRWRWEKHPDTGDLAPIGSCCTFVEGHVDLFKLYSEKYRNLQKNRPDIIQKMDEDTMRKNAQTQSVLGKKDVADKLIDNWAIKQKNKKI